MTTAVRLQNSKETVRVTSGTKRGGAYTRVQGFVVSGKLRSDGNGSTVFVPTGANAYLLRPGGF